MKNDAADAGFLVPDASPSAPGASPPVPLILTIPGIPRSRPRARHGARLAKGQGGVVKAVSFSYQPRGRSSQDPAARAWARAHAWYDAVQVAFWKNRPKDAPWEGPIFVTADIFLPRPKAYMRRKDPDGPIWAHTAPEDRDNLEKSLTDALKAAGAFKDDRQVVDGPIRKMYHAKGAGPGVEVRLWRIGAGPE